MDIAQDKLYKISDGGAIRFWWDTQRNNFQSERLNRPVYDEVLLMEIYTPGSRESSPVYEVKRRFDKETELGEVTNQAVYEKYKQQVDAFVNNEESADLAGTPLDQWTALDRNMVASLREQRIFTVEGLANLPDEKLRVLGLEGRSLRERAQAYLSEAAGGQVAAELVTKVAGLEEQLKVLTERAEAAEAEVAALKAGSGAGDPPPPPPPPAKPTKGSTATVQNNPNDGSDII